MGQCTKTTIQVQYHFKDVCITVVGRRKVPATTLSWGFAPAFHTGIHLRWRPCYFPSCLHSSLLSSLTSTIALLIIVVVTVVVVVVVVTVVVVVVSRPYPTVPGQMANPIAVTAPRPGLCSASYSAVVGFDCSGEDHHTFFSLSRLTFQHRHGSYPPINLVVKLNKLIAWYSTLMPYTSSIRSGNPPDILFNLVFLFWGTFWKTSVRPWHGMEATSEVLLGIANAKNSDSIFLDHRVSPRLLSAFEVQRKRMKIFVAKFDQEFKGGVGLCAVGQGDQGGWFKGFSGLCLGLLSWESSMIQALSYLNSHPPQQNDCLEVGWIRRIQELDTAYWGFFRVGTMFDIFQNIILIPYLEYGVLSPLDTAY
ncbi:hypothetical protein Tco_1263354 [Tanacetum coccineum]